MRSRIGTSSRSRDAVARSATAARPRPRRPRRPRPAQRRPPARATASAPAERITARSASGQPGLRARVHASEPAPSAAAVAEPEPEPTLGVAAFADDDYGDTMQNVRLPAGIAGGNLLVWLLGVSAGVVELVGIAFFVSVGLLLAAYMLREWQRDRTALICLAGALPLPITIISFFT